MLKYEKIILLSSSRTFSLSTPTFSLSTPAENNEATWKKATKCNKQYNLMFACGKGEITKNSECPITVRNLEKEVFYQLT